MLATLTSLPARAERVSLSPQEVARYSRHLIMPEVALEGQKRLKASSMLLIGAGGLGSPLGLYLAAAGVGRLGLVDFDVVDFSNLQRQVLHGTPDVGRPKLQSAKDRLQAINPEVRIDLYETRLTSANALSICEPYDVVIDGTDNFPTRFLVNDASVKLGIPVVHGSIFRFEGMVTVFDPKRGPTYRDMVPEPPPAELAPSCSEAGVLGVLPGIIGTLQAIETVKLILDLGDPLIGRLLAYDSLEASFREYKVRVDPTNEITYENRDRIVVAELDELCMPHPLQAPAAG